MEICVLVKLSRLQKKKKKKRQNQKDIIRCATWKILSILIFLGLLT